MNKVFISGRNVREIELTYAKSENALAIARFTIAVDRKSKNNEVDFIPVVAFGKLAETISNYVKKGSKVIIAGRIQIDNYNDKNGNKKTTFNIVADEVEFCDSKKTNEAEPQVQQATQANTDWDDDLDSDLPF